DILRTALEEGQNFWDTAFIYGPKRSEEIIGEIFEETNKRHEIVLATKAAHVLKGEEVEINNSPARSEERSVGKEERARERRRHTRSKRDWSSDVCSSDLDILRTALEEGQNFWDTAFIYGPKRSEEIIGEIFEETNKRHEIVLATKAAHVLKGEEVEINNSPAFLK